MTDKLFYSGPDEYLFNAKIENIIGNEIILDKTLFYPEGGGQPSDIGQIKYNNNTYNVTKVYSKDKDIYHVLDRNPLGILSPSDQIEGCVEKTIRKNHTRMHSLLHILNSLVYKKFNGARVTGAQINSDGTGRMDFNLPDVTNAELRSIEKDVNEVVQKDLTVNSYYISKKDALLIEGIIRTENKDVPTDSHGKIRIIDIDQLDKQACGGTHVKSTVECGLCKIQKVENKGRNNRRIKIKLSDV